MIRGGDVLAVVCGGRGQRHACGRNLALVGWQTGDVDDRNSPEADKLIDQAPLRDHALQIGVVTATDPRRDVYHLVLVA